MEHSNEEWKWIPGFENHYQVSNCGRVASTKYGEKRLMSLYIKKNGRATLQLHMNNKYQGFRVHRLVAAAFLENYTPLYEVNHKDGNPLNNRIENLEMVTHQENMKHAKENGLLCSKEKHGMSKVTQYQVNKIREYYKSGRFNQYELAEIYGINQPQINRIVNNKLWESNQIVLS